MIVHCSSCGTANRIPAARMQQSARCGRCRTSISPPAAALALHAPAELDELMSASLPLLVDFWAPWCGPCHAVAVQLEQIASRGAGKLVVAKIDTEELPEIASRYGIRSIPTMILFGEGRERRRVVGAMPAEAIEEGLQLGL